MRAWLQHHLNPLHLACRLNRCGLPFNMALAIGGTVGGWLRPLLYRRVA